MLITSIEPLNKNKSKVFIDEDFAFVLYKGELRKFNIKENQEIPEETYTKIVDSVLVKRAKERVLFILKSSDKTEAQLRRKLKEGLYPEKVIDLAVEYVKSYHYIDDENYAKNYVERMKNKKSKRQILGELYLKGIDKESAEEAFGEPDEDDLEEMQIRDFLKKKRFVLEDTDKKVKEKLISALLRKGYPYEKVSKIMRDFEENS